MNLNLMVFIQEIIYLNKSWTYVINPDEFKSIESYWKVLYVNCNNGSVSYDAIYFSGFTV